MSLLIIPLVDWISLRSETKINLMRLPVRTSLTLLFSPLTLLFFSLLSFSSPLPCFPLLSSPFFTHNTNSPTTL